MLSYRFAREDDGLSDELRIEERFPSVFTMFAKEIEILIEVYSSMNARKNLQFHMQIKISYLTTEDYSKIHKLRLLRS